jgi:signal transduction histidine kinase
MTTVLVVDESHAGRELLHTLLSLGGHHVVEADGGNQALAVARRTSPQVVVAETGSGEGGRDLVRRFRQDPRTAAIPLVLYGGRVDEPGLRSVADAYHVDRVVPKSPDPAPLLDAVDAVIAANRPGADPADAIAAPPADRPADVAAAAARQAREAGPTDARLDGLRRFAGEVAHGYNNALAVILSYGDFLRDRIGDGRARGRLDPAIAAELHADVAAILAAGRRAAYLTRQLQAFGHRGQPPTTGALNLDEALRPVTETLYPPPGVRLVVDLAAGPRPVVADRAQLEQLLRNLVENALDAMPGGGELRIETAAGGVGLDARVPVRPNDEPGDGFIRLTVRDTGAGMPAHVVQRATEPFFTTKPAGRGIGLGLTTVAGIVRQAGGDLTIESAPGAGTSVHVRFPVAADTGTPPPAPAPDGPGRSETVLVVDDEEPVRLMVQRILARAGYQVLPAADAAEALAISRSHAGPVHCLITDLAMPGLPGSELTRRLGAERPELAVLYMSGYAEADLHHVGNADNRVNLLPKPFTRVDLLNAVRATISESRAAHPRAP